MYTEQSIKHVMLINNFIFVTSPPLNGKYYIRDVDTFPVDKVGCETNANEKQKSYCLKHFLYLECYIRIRE